MDRLKVFFTKGSKKKSIAQLLIILLVVSLIAVIIIKRKTINLVVDGKKSTIITYKDTVSKALENNGTPIYSKDKITPALNSKINNKDTIFIKRAVDVEVAVDGKDLRLKSAENTVDALLNAEGITLKDKDKVQPLKDAEIVADMKIAIVRVELKTFTDSADIPFNTVTKNDNNLPNTVKKTIQDGKVGQKTTTTDVVYEDGLEVSRTVVNETIDKNPIDTIITQGTLPVVAVSRGGDSLPYTRVIQSRATAYEPINGAITYTSSGRRAVRDPNGYSTIAVDPTVIPIGTRVFVEGYGLAYAADTGTAIKGTTIDVFFNTLKEANTWAVKYVNVYILK